MYLGLLMEFNVVTIPQFEWHQWHHRTTDKSFKNVRVLQDVSHNSSSLIFWWESPLSVWLECWVLWSSLSAPRLMGLESSRPEQSEKAGDAALCVTHPEGSLQRSSFGPSIPGPVPSFLLFNCFKQIQWAGFRMQF